jgi:hypothetical protein
LKGTVVHAYIPEKEKRKILIVPVLWILIRKDLELFIQVGSGFNNTGSDHFDMGQYSYAGARTRVNGEESGTGTNLNCLYNIRT